MVLNEFPDASAQCPGAGNAGVQGGCVSRSYRLFGKVVGYNVGGKRWAGGRVAVGRRAFLGFLDGQA